MMLARDLMRTPVITISQEKTLRDAATLLVDRHISGLPIVDDKDRLVGILTSTDFSPRESTVPHSDVKAIQIFRRWLGPGGIEQAYREADTVLLKEVMNTSPVTAKEDDAIEIVAELMIQHDINHVPIIREEKVIGMITRYDFLRLAAKR